jgi:hypothetical protein
VIARMMVVAALAIPLVAGDVVAQGRGGGRNGQAQQRRLELERQAAAGDSTGLKRQQLEQQVRRTFWRVAKQRIGFTDDQMTRLEQTSQRFDQQRRNLAQQEKAARVAMRTQILADSGANQAVIASSLDQLQQLQRQRADLQGDEQKEFSTFMTPLQRAKLFALQEQVRKRMQDIVRARPESAAAGLRAGPP